MKKIIFGTLACAALVIFACKKEALNPSGVGAQMQTGQSANGSMSQGITTSSSDSYLLSVLNDASMDVFSKGNVFTSENILSDNFVSQLIDKYDQVGPAVFEVTMVSQDQISLTNLLKIAQKPSIPVAMVKNILITKKGLTSNILTLVVAARPTLNITEILKYSQYETLVSLCDQAITKSKNMYVAHYADGSAEYTLVDPIKISFSTAISQTEFDLLGISAGGGDWTPGTRTVKQNGEQTVVKCNGNTGKCAKVVSPTSYVLSSVEEGIVINLKNNNVASGLIASQILSLDKVSQGMISNFLKYSYKFSPYLTEMVLLTSDEINDDNLGDAVVNTNISDAALTNVLIMNAPLSNGTKTLIQKVRPNINLNYIAGFNSKDLAVSVCGQFIIAGSKFNQITTADGKGIQVLNSQQINLASIPLVGEVQALEAGCGRRFACGELVAQQTQGSTTTYVCYGTEGRCLKLGRIRASIFNGNSSGIPLFN